MKEELLTLREYTGSPPVFLWGPYCSSVLFFCYVFFVLLIYWFTMLTSLKGAHPDITTFGLNWTGVTFFSSREFNSSTDPSDNIIYALVFGKAVLNNTIKRTITYVQATFNPKYLVTLWVVKWIISHSTTIRYHKLNLKDVAAECYFIGHKTFCSSCFWEFQKSSTFFGIFSYVF